MLALISCASFWTSRSVTSIKLVMAASRTLVKQRSISYSSVYVKNARAAVEVDTAPSPPQEIIYIMKVVPLRAAIKFLGRRREHTAVPSTPFSEVKPRQHQGYNSHPGFQASLLPHHLIFNSRWMSSGSFFILRRLKLIMLSNIYCASRYILT